MLELPTLLGCASRYLAAGISIIPIRNDGSKAPAITAWNPYTVSLPAATEVKYWFDRDDPPGIAIIGGRVSGNLECLDFDAHADEIFVAWCSLVEAEAPGLIARLCVTRTPKPGFHVRYRCTDFAVPGNTKFAIDADSKTVLIETRGEGGYALAPGSPAKCHETGRRYSHHSGPPLPNLPTITVDEREVLVRCACSFNRAPRLDPEPDSTSFKSEIPGDAYNKRGPDWGDILGPAGWECAGQHGEMRYWRRPGKTGRGWSATTGVKNRTGVELMCVFSANAEPFPGPNDGRACSTHTKFSAIAYLHHGGDHALAAKALAEQGFGTRRVTTRELERALPFRAFPVEALPEVLASYVTETATALGVDPAMVALPVLATCAGAIGFTRAVSPKSSWREPLVTWCVVVAASGTLKSPAHDSAVRPIRERQAEIFARHKEAEAEYRRASEEGEEPRKPADPPILYVSDTTIEKLVGTLDDNPRGVLLEIDELHAFFNSFTRYKSGKGETDAPRWLSIHRAGPIRYDRKTGEKVRVHIPHAAVSVCGTIQPAILGSAISGDLVDSGMAARLLFAMPPEKKKKWSELVVSAETERRYFTLVHRLLDLRPMQVDGIEEPLVLELDGDAKLTWISHYDQWATVQHEADGHLKATFAKLEGGALRFAGLHHICSRLDQANGDDQGPLKNDSMIAGITLARWFAYEAERVLTMLDECVDERDLRRLIDWIERNGGIVTAREVQQGCRWLRRPGTAEEALEVLVAARHGTWESSPPGQRGQPTRRFRLTTVNGIVTSQGENANTVDVDTA
jgi:hypothetical protein